MNTLFLVDGSNILFRAYHALPKMTTRTGIPTGAVLGFCHILEKLEDIHHPTHIAVMFDKVESSFRTNLFQDYKKHRPPCPADLLPQFDLIEELLNAMGIVTLWHREFEADDLIASIAQMAEKEFGQVIIVSSDKDLMQLCDDHIFVLDSMKNEGKGFLYGTQEVFNKFGVTPKQLGDYLALVGDSSDNIPGVPGIGPKTALGLIQKFGSIDNILATLDSWQGKTEEKLKQKIQLHQDLLLLSRKLVTLESNIPLTVKIEDLRHRQLDKQKLFNVLKKLEFQRLLKKFFSNGELSHWEGQIPLIWATPINNVSDNKPMKEAFSWQNTMVLSTKEELSNLMHDVMSCENPRLGMSFAFDFTSQTAPLTRQTICGVALVVTTQNSKKSFYLPVGHLYLQAPKQCTISYLTDLFGKIFSHSNLFLSFSSAKEYFAFCSIIGVSPRNGIDPCLISYLIDSEKKHDIYSIAQEFLPNLKQESSDLSLPSTNLTGLTVEELAFKLGRQAQIIDELGQQFNQIIEPKLRLLFDKIELPLANILVEIERHGVCLDTNRIRMLNEDICSQIKNLTDDIQQQTGFTGNLQSPKQLQELLFVKLQLPAPKKNKSGFSTDANVLESLKNNHPVVEKILHYRTLTKLQNTYLEQLPKLIDHLSHRIHTHFQQLVVATGRLSSVRPNLQNIPVKTVLGREIRRAFVAPPQHFLLSADYSQIELRVLAHISQDPILIRSFLSGEDIHRQTAIEIFGQEKGQTDEMRQVAKMINYGILYGLTPFGLSTRLFIDTKTAHQYIKAYFDKFPKINIVLEKLLHDAQIEQGAYTLLGRFRKLPDLFSNIPNKKSYAERIAKNTPIQGTAADILKKAMVDIDLLLKNNPQWNTRMVLTVHDELLFEVPKHQIPLVEPKIKQCMESVMKLAVPLVVQTGFAENWADC